MTNEVPASWRIVRLSDVLSEPLVNGRSPRPGEGGLPVLRIAGAASSHRGLHPVQEQRPQWRRSRDTPGRTRGCAGRPGQRLTLPGRRRRSGRWPPGPDGHSRQHDPRARAPRRPRFALPRTPVEVADHAAPDRGTRPPGWRSDLADQPTRSCRRPAAAAPYGGTAQDRRPVGGPPRPHRRHHGPHPQRPRSGRCP